VKLLKGSKISSMPFLAGFIITFSNPMTPSLWLTLSGTVIRAWYYVSFTAYYIFIFSIIIGMIAWFSLLNYLALKGTKVLAKSFSCNLKAIKLFNHSYRLRLYYVRFFKSFSCIQTSRIFKNCFLIKS
jgi:threonine/homoserine/homoserine lactone efflux protein